MANDASIQNMAQGSSGTSASIFGSIANFANAGTSTVNVVANPLGGNALQITGRTSNYQSFDIQWGVGTGMSTDTHTYTIVIRGNTNPGSTFRIAGNAAPNDAIASVTAGGNGDFTLTAQISDSILNAIAAGSPRHRQFARGFRVQTLDTADFTIHEIRITR
jgi:hypothetical protein